MATGNPAQIEEERRLLYVAMTRAKQHLHLVQPLRFFRTHQHRFGSGYTIAPRSRFLPDDILPLFTRRAAATPEAVPTRWRRSRWPVLISGPGCAVCGASGARHLVNGPPQAQLASATREVLAGLVERVTFHNAENGFCVLRIKARGHRELITVIGPAAVIAAGEWVTAPGDWVNDRTHGQHF